MADSSRGTCYRCPGADHMGGDYERVDFVNGGRKMTGLVLYRMYFRYSEQQGVPVRQWTELSGFERQVWDSLAAWVRRGEWA
jgi:hypothetical protein